MTRFRLGETLLAIALILIGVVFRFLPHPANFAPIAAVALFSGVMLRTRIAWMVPLAAMIASDAVIGFHTLIPFTWGCFVLTIFIGRYVRRKTNVLTVIGGSLAGSALFYSVTNAAVWAFTPLYEKTLSGLFQSYVMALPFFRNTVLGDLFYTGALFGLYAFATMMVRATKTKPLTAQ